MEVQCYNAKAQPEGTHSTTYISWDEFRKLASVGDTIKEPFRTLTVTEKVFELTASGDQSAIQIHTR